VVKKPDTETTIELVPFILFSVMLLASLFAVEAGEIPIRWTPVENAEGYRIFYGTAPGSYPNSFEVQGGDTDEAIVSGLVDCTEDFIAVKGYRGEETAEGYSPEISGWPSVTVATALADRPILPGELYSIIITGTNFRPGALARGEGALDIDNEAQRSCLEITATVDVRTGVGVGLYDVTVRNTDSTVGIGEDALRVALQVILEIPDIEDAWRTDVITP